MVAVNASLLFAYEWDSFPDYKLAYRHMVTCGVWPSGLYTHDHTDHYTVHMVVRYIQYIQVCWI